MTVTAQMVKSLRDRTGAGMMDCKKALIEHEGNEEAAVDHLKKKGLAKVAKKAGAIAAEGLIHSYIHGGGRVGVLVEVNCQTDFVARNEEFKQFCEELSMHIASEKPEFVRAEEIDAATVDRQREIFLGRMEEEAKETGKSVPAERLDKILDGKIAKWQKETVLLDQFFIMAEDKKTVQSVCDDLSAKMGEKVNIRRFTRYERGEGIQKKSVDLAADVAATLKQN